MKIALASDHRGFAAKTKIRAILQELGHEVLDYGPEDGSPCDYPDMAEPAALAVASGDADFGVLLCGSGIGMSMCANKIPGIRAALCHDELTARMARAHNNANILCLPADLVGDALIRQIVDVWLRTPFEGGRHERRVRKISQIESRYLCNKSAAENKDDTK